MKWKAKPKKEKAPRVHPEYGDKREKTRFAFFPTKVKDEWIWMVKYIQIQEFEKRTLTEEVEVSSGLFEDALTTTGLVNTRTRMVTTNWNAWADVDRKLID